MPCWKGCLWSRESWICCLLASDPVTWSVCSLNSCWNLEVWMKVIQFLQFLHLDCTELRRRLPFPYGILKVVFHLWECSVSPWSSGVQEHHLSPCPHFLCRVENPSGVPEEGPAQLGSWQSFVQHLPFLGCSSSWGWVSVIVALLMSCMELLLQFLLLWWHSGLCTFSLGPLRVGSVKMEEISASYQAFTKDCCLSIRFPWTLWLSSIRN